MKLVLSVWLNWAGIWFAALLLYWRCWATGFWYQTVSFARFSVQFINQFWRVLTCVLHLVLMFLHCPSFDIQKIVTRLFKNWTGLVYVRISLGYGSDRLCTCNIRGTASKGESFQADNALLQERCIFHRDFDIRTCQISLSQWHRTWLLFARCLLRSSREF